MTRQTNSQNSSFLFFFSLTLVHPILHLSSSTITKNSSSLLIESEKGRENFTRSVFSFSSSVYVDARVYKRAMTFLYFYHLLYSVLLFVSIHLFFNEIYIHIKLVICVLRSRHRSSTYKEENIWSRDKSRSNSCD